MPKPLDKLSARELEALETKRYARVSANNRALIDAGFGSQRGNETRAAAALPDANPLFVEYVLANDSWQEVISELKARERWHGSHKPIRRRA